MSELKQTDLSKRLRAMRRFGPQDFELLEKAADEIERYYTGMLNWKATVEAKDREFAERRAQPSEKLDAALNASKMALTAMLEQFTKTPSTLKDSAARNLGHGALKLIEAAIRASNEAARQNGGGNG